MPSKYNPRRHKFTPEERSNGGKAGFYKAVKTIQERNSIEFGKAVRMLKEKINMDKPKEGK